MNEAEGTFEELGQEWSRLASIQALHKKRIEELEEMESVRAKYKETTTVETAKFKRGVVTDCSWFPLPVVGLRFAKKEKRRKRRRKWWMLT